tara:strand:+ start:5113 stop:5328 length:216 start_codon:yes stop_codon:yes gene_type:complete
MPLSDMSEMEAQIAITDFKLRKFLKEQMGYLKEIEEELESEDLEVQREMDLNNAKSMVEQSIQKVRFSGIL